MLTLTHPVELVLEKIMQETLHDHQTFISLGGRRPICKLRFANDVDLMAAAMMNFKTLPTDSLYIVMVFV